MPEKSAAAVQTASSRPPIKAGKMENLTERINRIHNAIARRAYEFFERGGRVNGNDVQHWLEAESEFLLPVTVRMEETDSDVVVQAEVPGFIAGDLEVNVEPRCVTITGTHQSKTESKDADVIQSEESSREIFQSVELPTEINTAKIITSLNNGVLSIQLPKLQPPKSRSVGQQAA